jgi:hypothetical protein
MSDLHPPFPPAVRSKPSTFLDGSRVARTLHGSPTAVVAVVLALMLTGCIIPPSLSSGTPDAGQDSPPAIVSVEVRQQVLPQFSNITLQMQDTNSTMLLGLLDPDIDDILYVSMFVDYDPLNPMPPRATCTTAPSEAPLRISPPCVIAGICEMQDVNVNRELEIVVFDRVPLDDGKYMTLPQGGLSATRIYTLKCAQGSP